MIHKLLLLKYFYILLSFWYLESHRHKTLSLGTGNTTGFLIREHDIDIEIHRFHCVHLLYTSQRTLNIHVYMYYSV